MGRLSWIRKLPPPCVTLALAAGVMLMGCFGAGPATAAETAPGARNLYPFASRTGPFPPSSGGLNPLLLWAELEPAPGQYNWAPLEKSLAEAKAAGRKAIPRVYTNTDGFIQATPQWFFDLPGARWYQTAFSARKGIKLPVSWDETYKQRFGAFLAALGRKFDGDPTIEFFQTNAGGGLYGEQVLKMANDQQPMPEGYSAAVHIQTAEWWLDQWQRCMPRTKLAVMVNILGASIGETVSAYAAERGIYLEQNSPQIAPAAAALFAANQGKTKIIMEIENGGGHSATGPEFDDMISRVFGRGHAIDYLILHERSFSDPATAQKLAGVQARIRQRREELTLGRNLP